MVIIFITLYIFVPILVTLILFWVIGEFKEIKDVTVIYFLLWM